jgi:CHAD domain-containing protein
MKSSYEENLSKTNYPVSLKLILEKEMHVLRPLTDTDLVLFDKYIHDMRKSLKSISAILLFYKAQLNQRQFTSLKLSIKSLAKHYAAVRESYVYLQTLNKIETELKDLNENYLYELRNQLELNYNSVLKEYINSEKAIQFGNEGIIKIKEGINQININIEPKFIKKRLSKNYLKVERIFKKLNTKSSPDEYHKLRKYCKYLYYQQVMLNNIGIEETSKQNKKLFKLTEYLGNEHDLELFYQYLEIHFAELSHITYRYFRSKIKRLRKKVVSQYPLVNYLK